MRFLATLAFCLFGLSQAFAADKAGAPAQPMIPESLPTIFSGLYVGATVGHGSGTLSQDGVISLPREGYTANAILGYNHVMSGILVGVEGDLGVSDISGKLGEGGFQIKGSSRVNGSLRARLGVVRGANLLYGTAGLAMTDAKLAVTGWSDAISNTKNTRGFVYGAGFEHALTNAVKLRLEALRFEWSDQNFTLDSMSTGDLASHETQVRLGVIVGLN